MNQLIILNGMIQFIFIETNTNVTFNLDSPKVHLILLGSLSLSVTHTNDTQTHTNRHIINTLSSPP